MVEERTRARGGSRSRSAVVLLALVLGGVGLTGCLTTPGDLAGTVRDTAGSPLVGIVVTLRDGSNAVVATTTTDADGEYELLDVEPGSAYTVGMDDGAGPLLDWWHAGASSSATATRLAIGDGATTVVDATMITPATAATFTGTVTDAVTAAPVAGVAVAVLAPGTTKALHTTTTAANGTYQVANLSPGSYVVRFGPTSPYAASYSGGARSVGGATSIAATPGATSVANGSLRRAGTITGTARSAMTIGVNFPVAGIRVFAAVAGDLEHPVATTTTAADGSYTLAGLAPGPYVVGFVDPDGFAADRGFAPAFFNTPRQANAATATPVTATAGGTVVAAAMALTGADCDPVRFPGTTSMPDHSFADLQGERLAGCTLGWAGSFSQADFTGADLLEVHGVDVRAVEASFAGARLAGAELVGGNLSGADFTGADLRGASLQALNGPFGSIAMFVNGADFTGADLTGARFDGADLTGVIWSDTTCSDGTNSDANGGTCVGHLVP